jgi:predicted amidohydrolase
VISDRGDLVTRYDERMLSNTKISYMYTPGTTPVTFEVDGVRFGCALGIEVHFPELFSEYERLDVDYVLFSSTGAPAQTDTRAFATEAQGHASTNSYWVSFAVPAQQSVVAPSGMISPDVSTAAEF